MKKNAIIEKMVEYLASCDDKHPINATIVNTELELAVTGIRGLCMHMWGAVPQKIVDLIGEDDDQELT